MERSFRFALIRVTPDPSRGETLNVGLATLDDDGSIKVHLLPSMRKVEAVNAAFDASAISAIPELVEKWSSAFWAADRDTDQRTSIGPVTIEEIGEFFASTAQDYERAISDLMFKLVDPVRRFRKRPIERSRLKTEIRDTLKSRNVLGREPSDLGVGLVVPHFPISLSLDLYADFAMKNGALHLINAIDFRVHRTLLKQKHNEACGIALSFETANQMFPGESRKIVVYADDEEIEHELTPHLNLLRLNADEMLNLRSPSETLAFVRELEASRSKRLL
jgi:hypothetical protein